MRLLLFFLSASTILASCSGDFFSQTLEIDPPEYEKQFVLHGFGSTRDSIFRVSVTQNYGILDNVPDSAWAVPGATVELFEEGQKKATLSLSGFDKRVFEIPVQPGFFQPGKSYELRATHPDLPASTGRQIMPKAVVIDSVRFRQKAGVDPEGNRLSAFDVHLKDEAGEENFYEIRVATFFPKLEYNYDSLGNLVIDTIGYDLFPITISDSDDPNAEVTYGGGIAVSDRFFDGQPYKFVAKIDESVGYTYRVYVQVITEEYYLWSLSAERKYNAEDNPLAEPVTTYTNLDNGIGAFGLANVQVFQVQ